MLEHSVYLALRLHTDSERKIIKSSFFFPVHLLGLTLVVYSLQISGKSSFKVGGKEALRWEGRKGRICSQHSELSFQSNSYIVEGLTWEIKRSGLHNMEDWSVIASYAVEQFR